MRKDYGKITINLISVFIIFAFAGIIAGRILESNRQSSIAASDNITVTDNYQVSVVDQSSAEQVITRTSTVTVKDPTATSGYHLTARIAKNTIPEGTAVIGSSSSTICSLATPCALPTDNTAIDIITTNNNNAISGSGDTTEWQVKITIPANTDESNYILDIEYDEHKVPDITSVIYMQDLALVENSLLCQNTIDKVRTVLVDRRNNQSYYVEKIFGYASNGEPNGINLCWMETNLRYAGNGTWDTVWGYIDDRYAASGNTTLANQTPNPNDTARPLTVTTSGSAAWSMTAAHIHTNPGGSTTLDTNNPRNNTTFYGYLYNYCSAMGGQSTACQGTTITQPSQSPTICPAGWRLPSASPSNEFYAMTNNPGINATNSAQGSINLRNNFLATYSGLYDSGFFVYGLASQGSVGAYYSSTIGGNATWIWALGIADTGVGGGGPNGSNKYLGYALRCVSE